MRPSSHPWRRAAPHLLLLAVVATGAGSSRAQETESPLSPAGRLRLDVAPTVFSWDSRFGLRQGDEGTIRETEPLAFDLTDPLGYAFFPGVPDLAATLRDVVDDPGLELPLGPSRAEVSAERIRLPFRLDLGVFEWLTVGVTVPLEKNRTEVTHVLRGDSSQLGVTPAIGDEAGVSAFLADVQRALDALRSAGGSPELEAELSGFLDGLLSAYRTSALFPAEGTTAGAALSDRLVQLNTGLQESGVDPVGPAVPLASAPLTGSEGVDELLTGPAFGYLAPLEDVPGVWELGDVEAHAAVRLAGGVVRDSAGAPARLLWEVGVGGLMRFPTGTPPDPDILLALGSGDGQTDIEGRLFANVRAGRLGLWADGRYGVQHSTTLVRRVAPPEEVVVPAASRRTVEWTPGRYLQVSLAPRLHLTPELAFTASYRYFDKAADEYAETAEGAVPEEPGFQGYVGPTWDASVLGRETARTVHEVGGGMIFSTVEAWREGRTSLPFEVRFVVRSTVAGRGGLTPKALITHLGIRVYRRLWGG